MNPSAMILEESTIVIGKPPLDKEAVVTYMVEYVMSRLGYDPATINEVATAVVTREEIRTTGVGSGLGIPHAKHPQCRDVHVGWWFLPSGIDFQSIDGKPVHVLILILAPPDRTSDCIRCQASASRLLIRPEFREKLGKLGQMQTVDAIRRELAEFAIG